MLCIHYRNQLIQIRALLRSICLAQALRKRNIPVSGPHCLGVRVEQCGCAITTKGVEVCNNCFNRALLGISTIFELSTERSFSVFWEMSTDCCMCMNQVHRIPEILCSSIDTDETEVVVSWPPEITGTVHHQVTLRLQTHAA